MRDIQLTFVLCSARIYELYLIKKEFHPIVYHSARKNFVSSNQRKEKRKFCWNSFDLKLTSVEVFSTTRLPTYFEPMSLSN